MSNMNEIQMKNRNPIVDPQEAASKELFKGINGMPVAICKRKPGIPWPFISVLSGINGDAQIFIQHVGSPGGKPTLAQFKLREWIRQSYRGVLSISYLSSVGLQSSSCCVSVSSVVPW